MEKKQTPQSLSLRSQYLRMEIKNNSTSWSPVNRNGWWIKFSVYKESNILMMFVSRYTGQTIIRYFMDEDDACDYINFVVSHDPRELLELS